MRTESTSMRPLKCGRGQKGEVVRRAAQALLVAVVMGGVSCWPASRDLGGASVLDWGPSSTYPRYELALPAMGGPLPQSMVKRLEGLPPAEYDFYLVARRRDVAAGTQASDWSKLLGEIKKSMVAAEVSIRPVRVEVAGYSHRGPLSDAWTSESSLVVAHHHQDFGFSTPELLGMDLGGDFIVEISLKGASEQLPDGYSIVPVLSGGGRHK